MFICLLVCTQKKYKGDSMVGWQEQSEGKMPGHLSECPGLTPSDHYYELLYLLLCNLAISA